MPTARFLNIIVELCKYDYQTQKTQNCAVYCTFCAHLLKKSVFKKEIISQITREVLKDVDLCAIMAVNLSCITYYFGGIINAKIEK